MSKYKLKIIFENKDVGETDIRFDDVLNSVNEVCKVLTSKLCKVKGVREKLKQMGDKEMFIEEVAAGAYIYEIEKLS